jgi:hypothetical protein
MERRSRRCPSRVAARRSSRPAPHRQLSRPQSGARHVGFGNPTEFRMSIALTSNS